MTGLIIRSKRSRDSFGALEIRRPASLMTSWRTVASGSSAHTAAKVITWAESLSAYSFNVLSASRRMLREGSVSKVRTRAASRKPSPSSAHKAGMR